MEKKRLENRELAKSESKYRHLFEKSPIAIYVTDRKGEIININQAGAALFGYSSREELIGKTSDELLLNEGADEQTISDVLEWNGVVRDFETRIQRADGALVDVQVTAASRTGLVGKQEGYEGFIIDITDRKNAEQSLKQSEQKYATVLNNSLSAIFMFHKGGVLNYVNPRLVELMGHDGPEDFIGRQFWTFIHDDDREMVKTRGLKRELGQIQPSNYDFRLIKKDGSVMWVNMEACHVKYLGDPAVVGNFIDITQTKDAEQKIQHLSRNLIDVIEDERKGLAADLHDEFGRSLTALQFDMEALKKSLPEELTEQQKNCDAIMDHIQHLAENIRKTTSRLRPDLLDHLGLVPTLKGYIDDFKGRRSDLEVDFQAVGLKKRLGNDTEIALYRIFQEGLTNIVKHSSAGEIRIMLTYSHPMVILLIKDDGIGFKQGHDGLPSGERHFGIGLLTMRERVAALGGSIDINSKPGRGTMIRVELPAEPGVKP